MDAYNAALAALCCRWNVTLHDERKMYMFLTRLMEGLTTSTLDDNFKDLQAWWTTKLLNFVGGAEPPVSLRCAWDPRDIVEGGVGAISGAGGSLLHIHFARACEPHALIVRYLVQEMGLDVNARDLLGRTPLHVLARSSSNRFIDTMSGAKIQESVRILVTELHADPLLTDAGGYTAAEYFLLFVQKPVTAEAAFLNVLQYLDAPRKAELFSKAVMEEEEAESRRHGSGGSGGVDATTTEQDIGDNVEKETREQREEKPFDYKNDSMVDNSSSNNNNNNNNDNDDGLLSVDTSVSNSHQHDLPLPSTRAYIGGADISTIARSATLYLPSGALSPGLRKNRSFLHPPSSCGSASTSSLMSMSMEESNSSVATSTTFSGISSLISTSKPSSPSPPPSTSTRRESITSTTPSLVVDDAAPQHFAVLFVDRRPPTRTQQFDVLDAPQGQPWLHRSGPPSTHASLEAERARRRQQAIAADSSLASERLQPVIEHRRIFILEGTSRMKASHLQSLKLCAEPESGYCAAFAVGPFVGIDAQQKCQAAVKLWRSAAYAMLEAKICLAGCDAGVSQLRDNDDECDVNKEEKKEMEERDKDGNAKETANGNNNNNNSTHSSSEVTNKSNANISTIAIATTTKISSITKRKERCKCPQKNGTGMCEFSLCAWARGVVTQTLPSMTANLEAVKAFGALNQILIKRLSPAELQIHSKIGLRPGFLHPIITAYDDNAKGGARLKEWKDSESFAGSSGSSSSSGEGGEGAAAAAAVPANASNTTSMDGLVEDGLTIPTRVSHLYVGRGSPHKADIRHQGKLTTATSTTTTLSSSSLTPQRNKYSSVSFMSSPLRRTPTGWATTSIFHSSMSSMTHHQSTSSSSSSVPVFLDASVPNQRAAVAAAEELGATFVASPSSSPGEGGGADGTSSDDDDTGGGRRGDLGATGTLPYVFASFSSPGGIGTGKETDKTSEGIDALTNLVKKLNM